jgi:hypothetical protein
MKKKWWLPFIFFLLSTSVVWANGGPVAWTETTPVGAVGLKQNDDISLVREDLAIDILDLNTYKVKAQYKLSSSAQIDKLQFGVPISWTIGGFYDIDPETIEEQYDRAPPEEIMKDIDKISRMIKIGVNGTSVSCTPVFDRHIFPFAKKEDSNPGSYTRVAAWCVAAIDFRKGDNRVSLEYNAQMDFEDMEFSKSALTEFSDRTISYLLYPAGYWNGIAREIHISVDPGPYQGYLKIKHPDRFIKKNNRWVWDRNKVDLNEAGKVDIILDRRVPEANQLATWNKREYLKFNEMTTVRASSELPPGKTSTYKAKNVLDGNPDTAWCEGKPNNGAGEYLEFRSQKESFSKVNNFCRLEGLTLSNGYQKNQSVYTLNNRIKKIAISDCQGGHRTEVPLLLQGTDYRFATELIKEKLDLIPDSSCFRIEILDTIPGKVNDTCISEVSLVVNCG